MTSYTMCVCLIALFGYMVESRGGSHSDKGLDQFRRLITKNEDSYYSNEYIATEWMREYNKAYAKQLEGATIAEWNYLTNNTDQNMQQSSQADVVFETWFQKHYFEAKRFYKNRNSFIDQNLVRMFKLMTSSVATKDQTLLNESVTLSKSLEDIYNSATIPSTDGATEWHISPDVEKLMASSRDYDELKRVWLAWRESVGPLMRPKFARLVEIDNSIAEDSGFADYGEFWRIAGFEEDNLSDFIFRLYSEVEPMYKQLHAYVRRKLINFYPDQNIDPKGPIPAHILGNMWAQQWGGIFDIVKPYPDVNAIDATDEMKKQGYTVNKMVETAEDFFESLGMEKMTSTFWKKSMFEQPKDRVVECHASAQDFMAAGKDDFRIKMCAKIDMEDLQTLHHEMGHIQYYMNYRTQPPVFRDGANEAFHEAIGDTVALSFGTPKHLTTIGLMTSEDVTSEDADIEYKRDINFLLEMALNKIAFLPFGLLIDLWRWDVYNGKITKSNYNQKWWQLRKQYQGLAPPVERSESDFDPGAKFHVASGTPYIRYFLSFIVQFQFHKALCDEAGRTGEYHKCDIYDSQKAGKKFMSMLELGSSVPWPEALEVLTGSAHFDAEAIKEYFQPLMDWLKKQNEDENIGWEG